MPKRIRCPINLKTKERFECIDCKYNDDCISDICDDFTKDMLKHASELSKRIIKIIKRKRNI